MVRSRKPKLFPKPTAIAVVAAVIGLALHAAVFFLVQISVQVPEEVQRPSPDFAFLGEAGPEVVAFIDPLALLVTSATIRPGPQLEDFRALSISREISSFPPYYQIEASRDWASWVPRPNREDNPGAWLLEHSESSLKSFGIQPPPDHKLPPNSTTIRIQNLETGEFSYQSVALPAEILALIDTGAFLTPASFLVDRTNPLLRPAALLVESSGDVDLDRAVRKAIIDSTYGNTVAPGYYNFTYFLSPIQSPESL